MRISYAEVVKLFYLKKYPIYINLARAPMLSDGESGGLFRMKDTGPKCYGLGWGGKRQKQTTRKTCHDVESGQGEVHGRITTICVQPVCVVSKMLMNAWCMCVI